MRAYPTNDDAIQSPAMPVPRSLYGPDTINVLHSTSRTPRSERGILREKDKGGKRKKERERSRRINLSDLGGGQSTVCTRYYMNTGR